MLVFSIYVRVRLLGDGDNSFLRGVRSRGITVLILSGKIWFILELNVSSVMINGCDWYA